MRHCLIIAFLLVIVMTSCNRNKDVVENVHALPEIYPDYRGVTVPWNIAPLNFCMTDDEYSSMEVWVKGSLKDEMVCEGDYADFDIEEWHRLLNDNKGGKVNVSVSAQKNRKWMTFLPFDIYISAIPINEWGITYRLVAPGYEIYGKQGIFQRCLSDFSESAIYQTTEVTGTCVNCHTPNATNPDDFVMHIRGEKGTTLIRHNGKDDYMKSRNDSLGGPMVFPSWHPTGKYIAFSTNETQQIFHSRAKKRIEYFDVKSDIFIYNPETHTALVDPRLATKEQMENCPVFAPDGQSIYFITATYRDPKRRVFKTDVKNLYIFCL